MAGILIKLIFYCFFRTDSLASAHKDSPQMRLTIISSEDKITTASNETFYTNEEILVECSVPGFLYETKGMRVDAIRKDGTVLAIGKLLKNLRTSLWSLE